MSSSCIVIMIAEMLGVKSGLGWYMTWQTGWASYDKLFAALFVICFIFTLVTKGLERIKTLSAQMAERSGKVMRNEKYFSLKTSARFLQGRKATR